MSAYVVDDKTINKIVNALYYAYKYSRNYPQPWQLSKLEVASEERAAELAQDLFEMNCAAVDARYGTGEAGKFRSLNFEHKFVETGGKIALYKAIQCLLYQCSEGTIPETELYKQLEKYHHQVAASIVEALPEYDALPWE